MRHFAGLVIDGIRHQEIVDEIRALVVPTPFVLVYIAADDMTLDHTMQQGSKSETDLHRLEQHTTELQVRNVLAEMADIRIINNDDRPLEYVLEELLHLLRLYTAESG